MRSLAATLSLLLLCGPSAAQQPAAGCDKPGLSLAREAAMIGAPHAAAVGSEMSRAVAQAIDVPLKPLASAQLPVPPERQPKPDTSAASLAFASGEAGNFRISVTEPVWIDVIQGGRYLEPLAVDGVDECAGLRKSLKVELSAAAFVLQFSDLAADKVTVTVAPAQ